jgi:hypothetical protein
MAASPIGSDIPVITAALMLPETPSNNRSPRKSVHQKFKRPQSVHLNIYWKSLLPPCKKHKYPKSNEATLNQGFIKHFRFGVPNHANHVNMRSTWFLRIILEGLEIKEIPPDWFDWSARSS